MKKNSGTEFQEGKTQADKKQTDVLDMEAFRSKKQTAQPKDQKKTDTAFTNRKQKKTRSVQSKVIRMDLYKKRYQAPSTKEEQDFHKTEQIKQNFDPNEKKTQIIALSDYRERKLKRKWKKEFFVNTAQVAGMTFLFLFMLMNLLPSLQGADSKIAQSDWFQAPAGKSIVIRGLAQEKDTSKNRTPDSSSSQPCSPSSTAENPIKAIKSINPKNCKISKF